MSAKHDEMCEGAGPAAPKTPVGGLYASLKGARGVLRTPLGLLMGGAALVLALMISLLAYISIERSEAAMGRLLAEKGSSFIIAFESILRSGMRSEAGVRLQVLLEEMASSPGIIFIAVTMPDGTIVAHSDRSRLGEILRMEGKEMDEARMRALNPGMLARWGIMHLEGRRVFAVYRQFSPGMADAMRGYPTPIIFLGLDISPFEITRSQNRDYVAMLSAVTLLVGLACLLALYYAERARESRQRQRKAEVEIRRLEGEVRRKEKLAAVGNLAAGVAHEIRNPLSSIKGYATYFGQRFPEGSEDRAAANVMVNEVDRLNRVIMDLIGLSRPSDVSPRPGNVEDVVQHVVRLIGQDAEKRGVEVECKISREVPKALVDPERMGQALLNLCINALDAMPEGGCLTLAATRNKKGVCLMVRDSGVGIPPRQLPHIFDPYFTTKGQGTGLGLAMVHKIVEAHNGEISVVSRQAKAGGQGETLFRIWLPEALNESQLFVERRKRKRV
ncbi:two-component system sensor histidine kinase ZraS [Desulfovibrio sp. MES5]|uniref:two-component system sensor histidine kinase ZraS n=1 Tax=Desulfovibrio sp. MES5 TaxID=1899016 RepID=UPI0025C659B9|nr:two-component system sensor histidine kinase ZraS [Desulfovibrio sp. MES5]